MLRFHLIFIIVIISTFLLTIQWIVLQTTVKNAKPQSNPQFNLLYLVTTQAAKNDIPLFIIDLKLINLIENSYEKSHLQSKTNFEFFFGNNLKRKKNYTYFNLKQKVFHLATLQEVINVYNLNKFIDDLKNADLTVFEFTNVDANLIDHTLHVHNINHLIIFNEKLNKEDSFLIHITIFQNKLNKYWISSPIYLTEYEKRLIHRQGVRKMHFQFHDYSHIFEKVSLEKRIFDGISLGYPEEPKIFFKDSKNVKFIECNKTRANLFYKQYGDDESEFALQFKMNAYTLIVKIKNILDELEIPFWLNSGTCLGYFRQCDFISYSQDVDIGIFITDYRDDLIDIFSMNDLPLIHLFGKVEDSFELSFKNGDIKLDIFFFYEENDFYWNGGTQAKTGYKFKYIFPKFELCWTEFLDLLVKVPCPTLTFITANYGDKWYEPIKNWDWKSSPSNVHLNGQWPAEEWHKVIQLNPYSDFA